MDTEEPFGACHQFSHRSNGFGFGVKKLSGRGRPSYHPKMMLKVLIYAYTQKIYSSRQIAKALLEQIPFRVENLPYDEKTDSYLCPGGQSLTYLKTEKQISANGYVSERRIYEASGCQGCGLKDQCHKSKYNRRIQVGVKLQAYREKARELLLSPEGLEHRSRRPIEPDAVFGQIKWNRQFRRFLLRGLDKVTIEFGLVAIAHNLMKLWQMIVTLLRQNEFILALRAILVARNLNLRKPTAFFKYPCQSV